MKRKMKSSLTNEQNQILKNFIIEFLPEKGNKRKNKGNEMEVVGDTFNRIFKKYFGYSVTRQDVFDIFEQLGYCIYDKKGIFDSNEKIVKPSKKGRLTRGGDIYEQNDACFVYIDIKSTTIRELRLTVTGLPNNTSESKLLLAKQIDEQLVQFKIRHNHLIVK